MMGRPEGKLSLPISLANSASVLVAKLISWVHRETWLSVCRELKAVNCANGDTLAQDQASVASKRRVLDALGVAAGKLRTELGESLATVQKFDVPLQQATTSSLEALRAYSLGRKEAGGKVLAWPCLTSARHPARSQLAMGNYAVATTISFWRSRKGGASISARPSSSAAERT